MKPLFALVCLLPMCNAMAQVWSDEFDNPGNWVIGHDGNVALDWQIGVGLVSEQNGPIASTTAANGYALVDSYGFENISGEEEQAHLTTAAPIDLSGLAMPLLRFQELYRDYGSMSKCYVVISTDGNFPVLETGTDITGMPNVFRLHDELEGSAYTANPEMVVLDISAAVAANPATVWVRFYWTGQYTYSWYVDDVSITEAPPVEFVLEQTWLSNSAHIDQVGSIPPAQLSGGLYLGGRARNQGQATGSNAMLQVEIDGPTPCSVNVPLDDLELMGTVSAFSFITTPLLAPGAYTATFTLACTESAGDVDPANNTLVRHFNIDPSLYAVDALDAVPAGQTIEGTIGTSTFSGIVDGLLLLNFMGLSTSTEFTGYEALITPNTQADAVVAFALYDSLDVFTENFDTPLHIAPAVTVTAQMVADGVVGVDFPAETLPAGGYYIGAWLYSQDGTSDILVRDDVTCGITNPLTSMIFIADDALYANGNALAVRLRLGDPLPCHAEYELVQALDGDGNPIPFVVNIVNTSTGGAGTFSYFWDFGDGNTSTEEFPVHDYATNGPYEVCLTMWDGLGCADQFCDSIMVDDTGMISRSEGFSVHVVPALTTNVVEQTPEMAGAVWPNPALDRLYFASTVPGPTNVRITDATGRVLIERSVPGNSVDVSALSAGTYFLYTMKGSRKFMKIER